MKKLLSPLLALVIVLSLLTASFTAFASESQESNAIRGFIDGITELVQAYDTDKEFTVPENDAPEQIQSFSSENTVDETDNNAEQEYTLQDFQTARLIVRANGNFNPYGALEEVSGFEDFHILQYGSPEAAMEAYENLQVEKNITEVDLDLVCTYSGYVSTPEDPDIISKDEFLNDWSRDRTQSKRLLEYLAGADIPLKEIIVGVVDTGIDYTHEIFEDRVERTYFNVSSSGNADDEMDSETLYHGTTVSSVIINNSPKNVKVAAYKVSDNDDDLTVTTICAGFLEAIEKQSDIISISLTSMSDPSLITECVLRAYSQNIPVFACVGNSGQLNEYAVPANAPKCIAVSATDFNNTTTFMNTLTPNSDVSAPGEHIAVAIPGDRYARFSGTSYSTPYAAALGAILKSVTPEITVDEIDAQLKETSFDAKRYNERQSSQGGFIDNYHSLWDGVGMIQFCNALGLEKLTAPEIHLEDKVYVGEQTCSITCPDEKAIVLYTTDGTYPAFENADVYTEPFQITRRTRIRAVAYYADEGYYSDEVEATPRIQYTDSDENFAISNDGIITKYNGNISDLYVPETINGITVTGFDKGAFNTVIGLALPKTVTEIPVSAFAKNSTIEFVRGEGIVTVKSNAFSQSNIMYVEFPAAEYIQDYAFYAASKFCRGYFPNVEIIEGDAFSYSRIISFYGPEVQEIDDGAFGQCSRLEKVYFPQCTIINVLWGPANGVFDSCSRLVSVEMPLITNLTFAAFNNTSISKADFPFVKTIEEKAFYNCSELEYINMPALLAVPKQAFDSYGVNPIAEPRFFRLDSVTQIEQDAFGKHPTARIELSHLESAKDLPQTEGCIITLPSTFKECTEDTFGRNYKVYGTKGTYAEEWANANGHEFIEISQETALLQDVPMEYTDETQVLCPDVIGFNRTYQWYGSLTADNTAGEPIEGATEKEFNPAEYPAYPYYYCVVTSTDVGFDPIEIRTGVTANKVAAADYSAYNTAVEKANALEREYYKDLTDLDAALAVDVSGLTVSEQAIVDAQTKAIEDALAALALKDADYTAYNAAVEKANALDRSLYADTTELDRLLSEDISGLTILEQDIVNTQTRAIEDALNSLVFKPADYTEYNKAVEQAKALDRSLYEDLTVLDETLAVDMSGKNITEQAEVDAQTQAILTAIENLVFKPADYTEYNKAVEQAKALNRDLYEDLTALDEALAADVSGKNITEQETVDNQAQAILNAISELVYRPADYTEVEKAVASVPEDLSGYTDESVSALQEVLNAVDYALHITEQETVDGYAKAIADAVNGLELKPVAPPVTEPTEPSEPANPENPSAPADTQNPDIPTTGTELPFLYGFTLLLFCGAAVFTYTRVQSGDGSMVD